MRYVIAIIMLFCAAQAWAGNVVVSNASARATAPGQESAAIQFTITSKTEARLVTIVSPVAGSVEIHSMTHDDGMMKMHALEFLPLPAGKKVSLGSSGMHVMLLDLKKPLKAGENVPLTITVEFADKHEEKISVNAEVKSLTRSRH
ncbi:Copper metallochaperone, bacterial analog of Cox17 protein [Candidatus Nitrotoga sp. BS]|uniref:copper chaperone PCu(A)C n=1 Tax=Candidatus Nitrotoga sp. BS TaxID=2890408 RepID=UPI001EF23BC6|nr:copper chaperone PCu(A)C [Candidatus Nitrotoga sp. BS]CAH1192849.1 Copper metallochaperone, bacterial analog of Cox17 protein [Candidatus Nitrotoga sp. BS]